MCRAAAAGGWEESRGALRHQWGVSSGPTLALTTSNITHCATHPTHCAEFADRSNLRAHMQTHIIHPWWGARQWAQLDTHHADRDGDDDRAGGHQVRDRGLRLPRLGLRLRGQQLLLLSHAPATPQQLRMGRFSGYLVMKSTENQKIARFHFICIVFKSLYLWDGAILANIIIIIMSSNIFVSLQKDPLKQQTQAEIETTKSLPSRDNSSFIDEARGDDCGHLHKPTKNIGYKNDQKSARHKVDISCIMALSIQTGIETHNGVMCRFSRSWEHRLIFQLYIWRLVNTSRDSSSYWNNFNPRDWSHSYPRPCIEDLNRSSSGRDGDHIMLRCWQLYDTR